MSKLVVSKTSPDKESGEVYENRMLRRLKTFLKKHFSRKKKKIFGHGRLMCKHGFTEKDLNELFREIRKRCPGVTRINIHKNDLSFDFECTLEEFLNRKKKKRGLPNPSKKVEEED